MVYLLLLLLLLFISSGSVAGLFFIRFFSFAHSNLFADFFFFRCFVFVDECAFHLHNCIPIFCCFNNNVLLLLFTAIYFLCVLCSVDRKQNENRRNWNRATSLGIFFVYFLAATAATSSPPSRLLQSTRLLFYHFGNFNFTRNNRFMNGIIFFRSAVLSLSLPSLRFNGINNAEYFMLFLFD